LVALDAPRRRASSSLNSDLASFDPSFCNGIKKKLKYHRCDTLHFPSHLSFSHQQALHLLSRFNSLSYATITLDQQHRAYTHPPWYQNNSNNNNELQPRPRHRRRIWFRRRRGRLQPRPLHKMHTTARLHSSRTLVHRSLSGCFFELFGLFWGYV
jgi:hypothetical protein